MTSNDSLLKQLFGSKSEVVLVTAMIGILLVLFSPIPAFVLDFLLIINFSFGLLVLLLTFYTDKPTSFSTFPSLLLIATLFRLSLNIAATRLILSDGDAGEVINAVGTYVVGGNYIIGLVVFLILIVVQYVVVTSGAQRVAEVAARFTLDSMPGKQMSIDADLNMGLIDEKEAKERRENIEKEANFYGSMDGASKFVKGDAIAGIIIILIDIIGGLTIGLAQKGMAWGDALHTYTLLTVGDGIVTQIPALVISTATGIIVTRAASDAKFGEEVAQQISKFPKSLVIVSIGLLGLAFLPGMPVLPILVIFLVFAALAYYALSRSEKDERAGEDLDAETADEDEDLYKTIQVDPIEIFVGDNIAEWIGDESGVFMEKIKAFRKQFAMDMGYVFPAIRIKEDSRSNTCGYEVKVFGAKVASGELYRDRVMAISAGEVKSKVEGIATKEPSYGLPAVWVEKSNVEDAKSKGYTMVDPLTVMVTHFSEIIKNHTAELLTRSECEGMMTRVRESQPSLLEELIPNVLSITDIQKVLQALLNEKVSIRNLEMILETLVDCGKQTKDPQELAELVRGSLGRIICEQLVDKNGQLKVLSLEPAFEQVLQAGLRSTEHKTTLLVDPAVTEQLFKRLSKYCESMMSENIRPVLLSSPALRRHIRKLIERMMPHLHVLSLTEIPTSAHIVSYGVVTLDRTKMSAAPATNTLSHSRNDVKKSNLRTKQLETQGE
ncbi:flagellar biosynthesis protein FlhA [Gammaproteobacteria bacterium 42_54_T18]|nr:flagellar biosynthesis protein FlhA [Gammaproteobacteria bacterium 42_54_T18]